MSGGSAKRKASSMSDNHQVAMNNPMKRAKAGNGIAMGRRGVIEDVGSEDDLDGPGDDE